MKVGFIGFGNMAQALARGFVRTGALSPDRIGACARDAAKLRRNTEPHGFRAFDCAEEVAAFADVVIVAVKPHQVEPVVVPIRERLAGRIVVSVAAGVTFDDYERMLLPGTAHLSTVPNTPVAVGEGIIVCERRDSLSEAQRAAVEELLSHVGMLFRVDTPLLGVAGTVCGCGPAFVAMFIEALGDAAVKHGIPRGRTRAAGIPRSGDRRRGCHRGQTVTAAALFRRNAKQAPSPARGRRLFFLSSVRNRYRTRSVRPMRSTVVGLMPFRAQIFFTVVPYFTARCPSVSPERILW